MKMTEELTEMFKQAGLIICKNDVTWAIQLPARYEKLHEEAALLKLAIDSDVGRVTPRQPQIGKRIRYRWHTCRTGRYLLAVGPKSAWVS